MDNSVLIQVVLVIATSLLGIIAFFLKSIHSDFQQFKAQVQELRIIATNLDTRTKDFFLAQEEKHIVIDSRLNSHSNKIHEHDKEIAILKTVK
jgi:hypothetical protein